MIQVNKKIELTDRQREAVYTHDCDLLVSAAAGSGKTAVLSERVLQSILDQDRRMSITDFLIVTFIIKQCIITYVPHFKNVRIFI